MKICSKCRVKKDEKDYYWKNKQLNRLHAQCKDCYRDHRKSYSADHYLKYGDQYRLRAKARRIEIRRSIQRNLVEYLKDKKCAQCTESDIRVLEFDHINPNDKKFGIALAVRNGMKWEAILFEIKKCQILCANCHKKRTAEQFGWFKALDLHV